MRDKKVDFWSCLLQPNEHVDRMLLARLGRTGAQDLAENVDTATSALMLHRWKKIGVAERLPADLLGRLESGVQDLAEFGAHMRQEVRAIAESLPEEYRRDVIAVKGADVERYYGELKHLRLYNDIDLLCRTPQAAFRFVSACRHFGYSVHKIRLERADHLSTTDVFPYAYGIVEIEPKIKIPGGHPTIDVHIGRFPGFAQIPLEADLFERGTVEGLGILLPSPEDSLLVMIAHASRHAKFDAKLLNDVSMILHNATRPLDITYIATCASRSYISGSLSVAVQLLLEHCTLSPRARDYAVSILAKTGCHWSEWILKQVPYCRLRLDTTPFAYPMLVRTLYRCFRESRTPVAATMKALLSAIQMVLWERPYSVWCERNRVAFASRQPRAVLAEVDSKPLYDESAPLHFDSLAGAASSVGLDVAAFGDSCLVAGDRGRNELVCLPCGVFCPSAYNGSLSGPRRAEAEQLLQTLRERLADFPAN